MKRWVDETEENFGPYWLKIARDRAKWKDVTEGYTQKWVAEEESEDGEFTYLSHGNL